MGSSLPHILDSTDILHHRAVRVAEAVRVADVYLQILEQYAQVEKHQYRTRLPTRDEQTEIEISNNAHLQRRREARRRRT